jgi:nanoRNase/pAp phosphatase (c-di-AMP/oligoRNAs hydrolase)
MKLKRKHASRSEKKLLDFLAKKNTSVSPLLILTHDFPDPDALASAYTLQYLADHVFGIKSRIVYKGVIGRVENRNMVQFLGLPVHRLKQREVARHAYVALVDTQPDFDNNPFPADRQATLVIDQHLPNSGPHADCAIIDTDCGATSVILARALLSLKIEIPEKLATALAYGILTDTLGLYRAKRRDTISTYHDILQFANMHILARIQTPVHDRNYFTTLSRAINHSRMRSGLIVCHLGRVVNPDVVSQIAEFFLCYKKAEWTLATGRFRNKLYASLRTKKKNFSAGSILRSCFKSPEDAGGHDQIAGGSVRVNGNDEQKWAEEEKNLQRNIVKQLNLKKGGTFRHAFLIPSSPVTIPEKD